MKSLKLQGQKIENISSWTNYEEFRTIMRTNKILGLNRIIHYGIDKGDIRKLQNANLEAEMNKVQDKLKELKRKVRGLKREIKERMNEKSNNEKSNNETKIRPSF